MLPELESENLHEQCKLYLISGCTVRYGAVPYWLPYPSLDRYLISRCMVRYRCCSFFPCLILYFKKYKYNLICNTPIARISKQQEKKKDEPFPTFLDPRRLDFDQQSLDFSWKTQVPIFFAHFDFSDAGSHHQPLVWDTLCAIAASHHCHVDLPSLGKNGGNMNPRFC